MLPQPPAPELPTPEPPTPKSQGASAPRASTAVKPPAALAALALGSNLPSPFGPPEANLLEGLRRLGALGRLRAVSGFHRTAPVGYTDQPDFLNAAALLETRLPPLDLLHALLDLEQAVGRDRASAPPKGPRTLDLDLLLYEAGTATDIQSLVLDTRELILPHPALHERAFVLAPLVEIAPTMRHPTLHRTIAELQAKLHAQR